MPLGTSGTVVFLSHGGGPLPLLGDPGHEEMRRTLRQLAPQLPRPSAIVVISAHWEEAQATVLRGSTPPLLYDYYGFPAQSYQLRYPAPGHPALAQQLADHLTARGVASRCDDTRGFDHGLFVPLSLLFPAADIPCVQLSLLSSLDAEAHLRLGEALRDLPVENLLIVGSGFSFHNMRAFFTPATPETTSWNEAFERWLADTCTDRHLQEDTRRQRLVHWESAPHARYCHPREEHLLPLHVCYGIVGRASDEHHSMTLLGKRASVFVWRQGDPTHGTTI